MCPCELKIFHCVSKLSAIITESKEAIQHYRISGETGPEVAQGR